MSGITIPTVVTLFVRIPFANKLDVYKRQELTPLIAQGKAVYENGIVSDKSSIDDSLLEEIEARKDEIAQETFDSCRDCLFYTSDMDR